MNDPSKPAYKPTHVTDSTNYDALRGTHRTKQVHYVMADGTRSYVEIPHDEYTADKVKEELDKAVSNHAAVMNINPGPTSSLPQTDPNPWGSGS